MLLTGDNHRAAARVAAEVGITDIRASLLPDDKVAALRALESTGAKLMLVGDGVNDAPALAVATVRVTLGHNGSDLKIETADVAITRDDLSTLPAVLALARRARRLVAANLVIAASFIAVLVTWTSSATSHYPLECRP